MNIIVDTCIWSVALRHNKRRLNADLQLHSTELIDLINETRVCMIGPVRQELLSGIKESIQFERLREKLSAFPDTVIITEDFENAAGFFNTARSKGVQGSNTDFLICAVSIRLHYSIYTIDKDFELLSSVLPVSLYHPRRIQQ